MTEPRSSWLFISLAGLALAAAGFAWGQRASSANGSEQGMAPRLAAAPATQALVHPRDDGAHRANTSVAPLPSLPQAEQVADDDGELEPDDQEVLAQEARIQHFDELSGRVDREVVDGAWRHETEGPLRQLMSQHLGPKVRVSEATCASTLCRVKLSHPDFARIPPGFMFAFDVARAPLAVTEVEYDNREERVTTLYFKRGPAPAAQTALADLADKGAP